MDHKELEQRRKAATPRGVSVMYDFYASKAENATLWDEQGREYIDFTAGIAVLNTGHRHPKIVAAVQQQLAAFTHTAYQIVPYASYVTLAERINALAPIAGDAKTTFFTTGAEAVENAVKIARAATGRSGVITFSGAFHGRTLLTMALTGKVLPYKKGFGPFPGSVFHARYPNARRALVLRRPWKVLNIFSAVISARRTLPPSFSSRSRARADLISHPRRLLMACARCATVTAFLLVADEVQSGFARTGKIFAMEYYPKAKADLITMAKSLGGGLPISGVSRACRNHGCARAGRFGRHLCRKPSGGCGFAGGARYHRRRAAV